VDALERPNPGTSARQRRVLGSKVRRRPSGEAPPLPRELGRTGRYWLSIAVILIATVIGIVLFDPLQYFFERMDASILQWFASWRSQTVVDVLTVVALLTSRWVIRSLRWATIAALLLAKRWRHLLVFVGACFVEGALSYLLAQFLGRPRPLGAWIVGPWQGYSLPSIPMSALAVSLVGMSYSLIPHGRHRDIAKWGTVTALLLAGLARVALGSDHIGDAVLGAVLGVAVGLTAFRWFTPNDIFPVTYAGGKSAHLDVGGRRGEAIATAVRDQLGYRVLEVKPVGLAGSGGSTPLRLRVTEEGTGAEHLLFAKLYAKSHVRADRWYKLGRTVLYGKLEDESPFQTVRRFVEYEDYTLRLMDDFGLPVPRPYGVLEITPEREYMIVMEFFDGAVEIGDAEIDDKVIHQGLALIREMWDEGLAHRDVKPANLMVRDGQLKLIDVFFVQVRPSPWRQAVDLANMMLVLGLRTDAHRVYEHALRYFTPEEIAEAFAATRGIASPTQLRSMMKADRRDLMAEFQRLAPHRAPLKIQRWSIRRVGLTIAVVLVGLIAFALVTSNWTVFA
jgi:tRNA A-37 threonylcarbamoyl transferase component Bud32